MSKKLSNKEAEAQRESVHTLSTAWLEPVLFNEIFFPIISPHIVTALKFTSFDPLFPITGINYLASICLKTIPKTKQMCDPGERWRATSKKSHCGDKWQHSNTDILQNYCYFLKCEYADAVMWERVPILRKRMAKKYFRIKVSHCQLTF